MRRTPHGWANFSFLTGECTIYFGTRDSEGDKNIMKETVVVRMVS